MTVLVSADSSRRRWSGLWLVSKSADRNSEYFFRVEIPALHIACTPNFRLGGLPGDIPVIPQALTGTCPAGLH